MSENLEPKVLKKNRDEVRNALEVLFTTDYISRRKLYWENFVRGIAFGAGGVIGATLLIGIFLWFLSIFDTIPLIGPFIDTTRNTIEQGTGSR